MLVSDPTTVPIICSNLFILLYTVGLPQAPSLSQSLSGPAFWLIKLFEQPWSDFLSLLIWHPLSHNFSVQYSTALCPPSEIFYASRTPVSNTLFIRGQAVVTSISSHCLKPVILALSIALPPEFFVLCCRYARYPHYLPKVTLSVL